MFKIEKEIRFCYGHRLLNHPGKCKHIHGHNVRAIITLAAEQLNDAGMVVDFAQIDRDLKPWIDQELDHNFFLAQNDPLIPLLESVGERFYVMQQAPTAENIAVLIYHQAKQAGLPIHSVTLWESFTSAAHYIP